MKNQNLQSVQQIELKNESQVLKKENQTLKNPSQIKMEILEEKPNNHNFLPIYYFIYLLTNLTQFLISGLIFIIIKHKNDNLSYLALFGIINMLWKIIYNIIFFLLYGKKLPDYKSVYIFEIILYSGHFLVILGFYLFFTNKISSSNIFYFSIHLIPLTLIRAIYGSLVLKCKFLLGPFLYFFESIFILIISLKIGDYLGLSWTVVLLPWYILSGFLLLFCFFMVILKYIFIFVKKKDNKVKFTFIIVTPMLCYFGASFFNVIHGFKLYFEKGRYFLLYGNGYFMAIGGFIILPIFCFLYFKFISNISNLLKKKQAEKIILSKFAKDFFMDIFLHK